jgi:hypothetical protein
MNDQVVGCLELRTLQNDVGRAPRDGQCAGLLEGQQRWLASYERC